MTPKEPADEPHLAEVHTIADLVSAKTPEHLRGTNDDKLALDFVEDIGHDLRHVQQWGKWLAWTGTKWDFDYLLTAISRSRTFVRDVARGISDRICRSMIEDIDPRADLRVKRDRRRDAQAHARRLVKPLLSVRTIHAVANLAKSDKRIASTVEQWDADPWLLNTPGGTVDLRTGNMRRHNPLDYITRSAAVAPGSAQPIRWLEFLKTIMHGDEEMILYLQKVFGYCLVGETKEHEMYFAYGTGANGKGVTLNTMRNILGDYGVEAAIETFIITQSERHPTELADLRGARLVTCGETDEGQRWAEARIKTLTGGDPIKARFMRQDFFQYQPQFKLVLAGNHKPRLANVDEAIERRFRLIPFTFTVPKDKRDVDLAEKLKAEWPGILAWAIDGCLQWQTGGLRPPRIVSDATRSYLSQEDAITAWYQECCAPDPQGFVYVKQLFASWEEWARSNGEDVGTKRKLTRHLEDREPVLKIRKGKREEGFGFYGLELTAPVARGE